MAAFETPAQHERDIRSGHKEWKRTKDSSAKWSHGHKPAHGCRLDGVTLEAVGGTEEQRGKSRPRKKYSEMSHHSGKTYHNIVKANRANWELPAARVRGAFSAQEELRDGSVLSRSLMDLMQQRQQQQQKQQQQSSARSMSGSADDVLYSFDRNESPGVKPVTLDVFVRPSQRATEKLVEREYEVLDANGDALTGRKARRSVLRKAARTGGGVAKTTGEKDVGTVDEDEGFELI